ncbi:Flavin mononucleotide hydrolase 1, chloroplatic [Sesamum alatum]|uniref:Flavin mononucleotide hydrolase 1, chloroplatic n=1 Tax=Sesamum alatum TaxID=300844 RepID=A0AAE2CSN0_9LAMI|nr:Flavin mononucleotide hydrolase 1, chloroplatic [Sesamum alatum]
MAAQRLVGRFSSFPMVKLEQRPPSTASQYSTIGKDMSLSLKSTTTAAAACSSKPPRKLPVLLFDIMDTIVRDPFYHDIPAFFGMSMKELLECKHPTAWIEFEKGLIDEMELARKFFKDGRPLDLEGLKSCMRRGYSYIEGVEALLIDLKKSGYEMHAFTNYPIWYEIIEEKLKLSTYLSWTFCSCIMGKRKPDPDFYMDILKHLKIEPACCIFIDDRMKNVEAAVDAGFIGIQFKNVDSLRIHLSRLGVVIDTTS